MLAGSDASSSMKNRLRVKAAKAHEKAAKLCASAGLNDQAIEHQHDAESLKRSAGISESPLRQLARLLREDDQNLPEQETGDSLDAQVDRYLSDYEASSRTAKHEGRDFRQMIKRLMREAGDEDELGGDAGGEAETETEPAPEPTKPSSDSIDIEEFANSVARLIQNYDTLLEVQSTLIRRATNFVSKNYDQTVIDGFEKAMRDKHGLVDGETKQEVDDEMFAAPPADRAGPGGAGS